MINIQVRKIVKKLSTITNQSEVGSLKSEDNNYRQELPASDVGLRTSDFGLCD